LLDHDEKIIIWWAELAVAEESATPGKLIITDKEILVQTGKNAIKLLDIEVKGKRLKGEQIQNYFNSEKVKELK
jgi:methionyl-tRNA formyltransferase